MNDFGFVFLSSLLLVLMAVCCVEVQAQSCRPSGRIRGKNPLPGQCNTRDDSDCCKDSQTYLVHRCSPPVSGHTSAHLTLNSFKEGGDGGDPSECDNQYRSDDTPVMALSTGWFDNMSRWPRNITIYGNGRSVEAMVVDECDPTMGFNEEHDYQPPCDNDIVDAARAMWEALGMPKDNWGWLDITWSDA